MGKKVSIRGVVIDAVAQEENQSVYRINTGEREYAVLSKGMQAVKDNLFIRKGQQMIIEGQEKEGKILFPKSKIIIKI